MDHNQTKPKRRSFQYRLKTLLLLPVVVGLLLVLYLYWDEWKKYRPPNQQYDFDEYEAAFNRFADDLQSGRTDQAYESTSARFRNKMSLDDFKSLIGNHPAIQEDQVPTREFRYESSDTMPLWNWSTHGLTVRGSDNTTVFLCAWVVMDDSFFHRRPPPPRVEEIQVRSYSQAEWESRTVTPLLPSWEQE